MSYERFLVDVADHVAHVRLNRPDKANALDGQGWQELKAIFDQLDQTREVRVIVLSGEGNHFCAGADQQYLMSSGQQNFDECDGRMRENLYHSIRAFQDQISSLEKCRKPVLAAIHGACVGGAVDLITACDMRYATEDAYFAIAEIELAIVADVGTLQRLPQLIGDGLVRELTYTGRRMYAPEAKAVQLVNKVYGDKDAMLAEVMETAQLIGRKSPLTVRGAKHILNYTRDHSVADSLNYVATWNAAMLMSQDLQEAMTAALSRKTARFKD